MSSSEILYAIFLLFTLMFSYSKLIEEKSSQNKIKNVYENLESSSDTSVLKYLNPFFIRKAMNITNAINRKQIFIEGI